MFAQSAFVPRSTDSRHSWRVVPNLARGMELTGVNQLWVADITYSHLAEQFAYLAVVLNAISRKSSDGHSNFNCGPALPLMR
ncbi:MAG: hypothetical protein E5V89_02855 [Mesorhizobium sp.]|uniref:hypothetical protein n=1 Tax=Mesorhizobium sp. TaxID=1871066 RepID=UPI000FE657E0|nr:hypothetical protein [Mesorhizobium sp.]RWA58104.1 MAG: hypothetical protein EOQ28_34160 [Mesorhizobium sp.]TIV72920.1 MAG: hypothetical protein E5V89_02855 [Mesorhizobium sp.]